MINNTQLREDLDNILNRIERRVLEVNGLQQESSMLQKQLACPHDDCVEVTCDRGITTVCCQCKAQTYESH